MFDSCNKCAWHIKTEIILELAKLIYHNTGYFNGKFLERHQKPQTFETHMGWHRHWHTFYNLSPSHQPLLHSKIRGFAQSKNIKSWYLGCCCAILNEKIVYILCSPERHCSLLAFTTEIIWYLQTSFKKYHYEHGSKTTLRQFSGGCSTLQQQQPKHWNS